MNRLTIGKAIKETAETLVNAGCGEAHLEARLLVAHAAKSSVKTLQKDSLLKLSVEQITVLDALLAKRLIGMPLQYVLGEWEFMGLPMKTDARALIPRQDTETLCEEAIRLIRARGYRTCLDMCCGTGCIGIALAKFTSIGMTLADCDEAALALSCENAQMNGIEVERIHTDLFCAVQGSYDLITCNPPYLSDDDMALLQTELAFEPRHALYGGSDGLEFYRRLAKEAMTHINPGGALMMEVGIHQAQLIAAMFGTAKIIRDLNGIERVVTVFG